MGTRTRRFLAGFVVGIGLMNFYLYHFDDTWKSINQWLDGSQSSYRKDRTDGQASELW